MGQTIGIWHLEFFSGGPMERHGAEWSSHIQIVDERDISLIKVAFEAGYEIGIKLFASQLGRMGEKKGAPSNSASRRWNKLVGPAWSTIPS